MAEKTRPRIGERVKMWAAADFADESMAAANCTVDSESLADFADAGTGTTGVRWTVAVEVETGGGGGSRNIISFFGNILWGRSKGGCFLGRWGF